MNKINKQAHLTGYRRPWQPPTLRSVGTVGDVLQGGGGKLSAVNADPGESRKEKPTG